MNDKEKFIADLYPAATEISQETGMSKALILAQAAQETGWGEHVLPGTNNIFNVKAAGGWTGPTQTFRVWEIENGEKVWKDQAFRVYGSVEEALRDRVKFLQDNPRYAKAGLFDEGTKGNLEKEAAALQKAGYATDPNYAKQLAAVYNSPTMQRAIQHAQGQSPAVGQTQAAPQQHQPHIEHGAAKADGLLKEGTHGHAVHDLQTNLAKSGYKDGHGHPLKADGNFGIDTRHAVERFQHDHGLAVDGIAGPKTLEALHQQSLAKASTTSLHLDHPAHPDHALYQQAREAVHRLDAQHGHAPDQRSDNLAAALVVAARHEGMHRIDQALLSEDATRAFAVQGKLDSPLRQLAHVETLQALDTPIAQSSDVWKLAPQRVEPMAAPALQPAAQDAPSPGR